jgi:acetyl esterase/lipase
MALLIGGCMPRTLAELLFRRPHSDLVRDIPFGSAARQRLDLYRPKPGRERAPVIVFLYGGRWQHGSKRDYRLLAEAITGRGFIAVVPDYRLYPAVGFPGWIEDAARAVRWVHDSIGPLGGDPENVVVVGHSSGAHTAALLALDERYLRNAGLHPTAVRGFVSLAGPVATEWTDPDVRALMAPRKQWALTYPMEQVDGSEPPLLLLHGGKDRVVAPGSSLRLASRIRDRGGCTAVKMYSGLGHVGIVVALSLPQINIAPVLDEVIRFARRPTSICGRGG